MEATEAANTQLVAVQAKNDRRVLRQEVRAVMLKQPDPSKCNAKDLKTLVKYHMKSGFSQYTKKDELLVAYNKHKGDITDSDEE